MLKLEQFDDITDNIKLTWPFSGVLIVLQLHKRMFFSLGDASWRHLDKYQDAYSLPMVQKKKKCVCERVFVSVCVRERYMLPGNMSRAEESRWRKLGVHYPVL